MRILPLLDRLTATSATTIGSADCLPEPPTWWRTRNTKEVSAAHPFASRRHSLSP